MLIFGEQCIGSLSKMGLLLDSHSLWVHTILNCNYYATKVSIKIGKSDTILVVAEQGGDMFFYKHRVRYYETDKMGVAHHSSFVLWFENARVEYLRSAGINYKEIEESGYNLAVVEVNGRFLKPVFFDELISVGVSLLRFDGKYAMFDYKVYNENSQLVVKGYTKHFVVDRELKRASLPANIVDAINSVVLKTKGKGMDYA